MYLWRTWGFLGRGTKQYPLHAEIQAFKVIALFGSFVTWTIKHIWFGKLYTWGFTIFHVLVKGFEIYWILPSVGPDNGSLESLPIVRSLLVEVSPGPSWYTVGGGLLIVAQCVQSAQCKSIIAANILISHTKWCRVKVLFTWWLTN